MYKDVHFGFKLSGVCLDLDRFLGMGAVCNEISCQYANRCAILSKTMRSTRRRGHA